MSPPKGRPKRPANPGYQAPSRLLSGGLVDADGKASPKVHGAGAMALSRELLLRGVPLPALAALAQEAESWTKLSPAQAHARCLAAAKAPLWAAYPLLADWLRVGAGHLNSPEALAVWILHVRRVAIRAGLTAALMAAQLGQIRARRQSKVRKDAKRGGRVARPGQSPSPKSTSRSSNSPLQAQAGPEGAKKGSALPPRP